MERVVAGYIDKASESDPGQADEMKKDQQTHEHYLHRVLVGAQYFGQNTNRVTGDVLSVKMVNQTYLFTHTVNPRV